MTLNGWSHYDFILSGYDPTLKAKPYVSLDVKTYGMNVGNLKMTGNIYGTIEQLMNNAPPQFRQDRSGNPGGRPRQGVLVLQEHQ